MKQYPYMCITESPLYIKDQMKTCLYLSYLIYLFHATRKYSQVGYEDFTRLWLVKRSNDAKSFQRDGGFFNKVQLKYKGVTSFVKIKANNN